ncbi:MAG TPA: DNA double-strand break repair nuclease NurA [Thermoanaerobacterales bacterium]|nr:DNA double-strand break repair nuclease NurA [Thermoanaerobacterales bacterium]
MLELDWNLKKKFEEATTALKTRLRQKPGKAFLRKIITEKGAGIFRKCRKLDAGTLSIIVEKGGVAGVDGSTNSGGGTFPYVITLQQAMAMACQKQGGEIVLSDAFSPLLMEETMSEDDYREYVKKNLAVLEANAALLALEEFKPAVLLMDGSLVRFKIEASHLWDRLGQKSFEQGTLLAGVVEGISTGIIYSVLKDEVPQVPAGAMDWEILSGILEVGEVLEMAPGLFKEGFRTCFARFSTDPRPIGIDTPEEQDGFLEQVEDLIFTLTPENGRGIPVWLDIIDNKVKITDMMMEGLMNSHLGQDYAEFISPKRNKRMR